MNPLALPHALAALIADHDGVLTRREALTGGLSDGQLRRLVIGGALERVGGGVFFSRQHRLTDAARLRMTAALHRGVVDRSSAAWWHGLLAELPASVSLSVPPTSRAGGRGPFPATTTRRTYPAEDLEEVRGLAVVRAPLAVLGAADELTGAADDLAAGAALLDRALQIGAVTPAQLRSCLDRNRGARGLRAARELVGVLETGSESEAERLFIQLLREYRITGWVQQYRFGRWRLDFAWPQQRVAVEIQGWAWHRSRDRFEGDAAKSAALSAAHWLELPYTWRGLTAGRPGAAEQLLSALNGR